MANFDEVWDADTGQELLTLKGHAGWVRWAEFSPDGQFVVTASHDQTVKVWNLSPKDDSSILGVHNAPVRSVAVSRDGQWMVTGSEDQTAVIWALRSGARQFVLRGHDGWVSSVAFAPDGARIATGSEDHTATLWSAVNGREILKFEEHGAAVYAVAYSPNGQWLATGSADRSAIVWDVATGEKLHSLQGHSGAVWAVAFSPDGQRLLTGSEDGSARIWDASAGRPIQILQDAHRDPVRAVAWSPDGGRFLTASVDGTAIVWDAATGTNAVVVLTGHRGPIWSAAYYLSGRRNIWTAAFSPSGRRIVTGGDDGTVRVWDAASGQELLALEGPAEAALSAAFSPDGRSIVAGSADGRVWRWEMASPDEVAAWQAQEHREDQRLAELKRLVESRERQGREARAGDPGAIKQWLILGPIRLNVREEDMDSFGLVKQQVIAEAMEHEQILDAPEKLLPRAGNRVEVDHRRLVWQAAHFDDYIADFAAFFGRGVHWRSCVGYAVCYIHSESGQAGLQMRVAWDDFVKVYLNGALVHRSEQSPWSPEAARVQVLSLHRGRNVLVLKLADEIGDWKASIRFTDSADNPVQGIRVTLSPDEP